MTRGPRLSVVVPCHDYGRFLEQAVGSLINQTRPPDEIVIIDDGSSDCTPAVVEELRRRQSDIVAIRRDAARGAAETFNDGVRASTGELVVILSADDRLSEAYLERAEAALLASGAGFAYTGMRVIGTEQRWMPAMPFCIRSLMRPSAVNGSAMFRRRLFDDVGGWRSDLVAMEDWEFWIHAVDLGYHGVAVDGCWVEYRRHPGGSRNTIPARARTATIARVWALHRRTVRLDMVATWAARAAIRTTMRRFSTTT